MRNTLGSSMIAALAAFAACATAASAQERRPGGPAAPAGGDTIHLVFDHGSRMVSAVSRADSQLIASHQGKTIRLRKPATVVLTVVGTNTALYDVAVNDTIRAPEATYGSASDLLSTLVSARTFLPQALSIFTTRGRTRAAAAWTSTLPDAAPDGATDAMKWALPTAQSMEPEVATLDSLFAGPQSVASLHDHARAALLRMRDTSPERSAQLFRREAGLKDGPQCRGDTLLLYSKLIRHTQALRPRSDSLGRALTDPGFAAHPGFRDSLILFHARADSAIRMAETLMPSASQTEHLVTLVTGACSRREAPRHPQVSSAGGQRFVIQISRRTDAEVAPVVADLPAPPEPVDLTILPPRALVTVSAGLSFLLAPDARFSVFGTRTDSTPGTKGVQIYRQNTTDARYSWGATVGLSWRFFDWTAQSDLALWVPELTLQQSSGTLGFAVGPALSYRSVKLGGGVLWVQHAELQGNKVGDHIPNAGYFQVGNTFGKRSWYVSISVFGVPPFSAK